MNFNIRCVRSFQMLSFNAAFFPLRNYSQLLQNITGFEDGIDFNDPSNNIMVSTIIELRILDSKDCDITLIDNILLRLRKSSYSVSTVSGTVLFQAHVDHMAYFLSSGEFDQIPECSVTFNTEQMSPVPYQKVTELLVCDQIQLERSEYEPINDYSIFVPALSNSLSLSKVHMLGDKVRVCVKDYIDHLGNMGKYRSAVVFMVSVVCLNVSIFCILLTLLTYYLFPRYCSLPGKLNVCLVLTLLLAVLFFELSYYSKGDSNTCIVIGILLHYSWLCFFSSLNAYCIQMYRLFCIGYITEEKLRQEAKKFKLYVIYIIVSPAAVVFLTLVVNKVSFGYYGFGFNGTICFIIEPVSRGVVYTLPVSLTVAVNTVFFVCTLRKDLSYEGEKADYLYQQHCFTKLFSVTCVIWILQLVDVVLIYVESTSDIFTFIATVINSSEGLLIAFVFVCNRHVYYSYRQLITCYGGPRISDNKGTEVQSDLTSKDTKIRF